MGIITDYEPRSEAEASEAIETARGEWERIARMELEAGREIPITEVPRSLGDVARTSVEATDSLMRAAVRRSYVVSIDIRALEARRAARGLQGTGITKPRKRRANGTRPKAKGRSKA